MKLAIQLRKQDKVVKTDELLEFDENELVPASADEPDWMTVMRLIEEKMEDESIDCERDWGLNSVDVID